MAFGTMPGLGLAQPCQVDDSHATAVRSECSLLDMGDVCADLVLCWSTEDCGDIRPYRSCWHGCLGVEGGVPAGMKA